ncbi:hypothetical protein DYD21_19635 [Rhodohalobacter sp. SW132]|uniref:hypothetical protein n=1 Tax=Rhodohalobacter sp. SW132 TaxID=2293433 RepID=UPI000E2272D4|nr:hypothetical protein [Rhodohalobacter sp. SW132]REL24194.1 hypothetical protein DYD21_19635 [Rhodohalobacter sp. SW132]
MKIVRLIFGFFSSVIALIAVVPVFILGIPFWTVRLIQKRIMILVRKLRPIPATWDELIQFYPVIGWKPKENLDTYATDLPGNRYSLSTDNYGWRNTNTAFEESDIIVFGDSFAFGFGVSDKDIFGNVQSELSIKTVGANGYNMVQEYLLMEKYRPHFKEKTVIWFIYHGNDLYENLTPNLRHYRMPFVREKKGMQEWEIVTEHVNPTPWQIVEKRDYYGALANICTHSFLSERAFSGCEYLIKKGSELCARENAELIIFSLPDIIQIDESRHHELKSQAADSVSFDPDLPDKRLKDICERHSIPFYTTKDFLGKEHFIKFDIHWNIEGNKQVAQMIHEAYTRNDHLHRIYTSQTAYKD